MVERPIIFTGESVRAILEGRKTQTRRVVRWPIVSNGIAFDRALGDIVCRDDYLPPSEMLMDVRRGRDRYYIARCEGWEQVCHYGAPGDRLWVRETWALIRVWIDPETGYGDDVSDWKRPLPASKPDRWSVVYRANEVANDHRDDRGFAWRSPIHMPRWASRMTLRVTDVRVERLKDISADDIRAEGLVDQRDPTDRIGDTPTLHTQFGRGWDSINGKRAPWSSNPWVWVIAFEKEADRG